MKRGADKKFIFCILIALLILNISFVFSQENGTDEKGYACLQDKVQGRCSSLSTEEKAFSLMAIGQCSNELVSDSLNSQCWPDSGCKLKTTAQAIIALAGTTNLNNSAMWLLGQKTAPTGIDWLLQIGTSKSTKCTIGYQTSSGNMGTSTIAIDSNKQISGNPGSCLSIYTGGYWLKISSNCFGKSFTVSCNDSFSTNLLFKDQASSTIYLVDEFNSQAAGGTTTEQVNSYCLKQGSLCSYEGTMWAALSLKVLGYDYRQFIPYLITQQSLNEQYLPEAFLYMLTGDDIYKNSLLQQQAESKWWLASGDKFYDTAVALLPFQSSDLTEKLNSIDWLSSSQGADGCWQGNIRNTAFILYSVWPKTSPLPSGAVVGKDCELNGYFCLSQANCNTAGGILVSNHTGCFSPNICCSKSLPMRSCGNQSGIICSSSQTCSGRTVSASDANSGQTCCIAGTCQASSQQQQGTECAANNGECRSSCLTDESQSSYGCSGSDICCIAHPVQGNAGTNYLWIIIFSVLIVLVVLAILFRKKIKNLFSKLGKGKSNKQLRKFPPSGFPPSTGRIQPRLIPRKIIPQSSQKQYRPQVSPTTGKSKEAEDVLKKLKEIGQ